MTTSPKRSGLLAVGIVIMLAGLLAGLGLWYSSGQRSTDAVRNMARAPIGCDTTLDFEAAGEFFVFIESSGRFDGDINGDCGAVGDYEISSDVVPAVSLSLTSPDGDDVNLDSRAGISYDADGFVGQSIRRFTIETPGDYQLRVQAPGSEGVQFAAAVGRDPADGVGRMRLGAALAALAGLVVGGGLIVMSRRTAGAVPEAAQTPWPMQPTGWPTSPPGAPTAPPMTGQPPLGPPTQYPMTPPTNPGTTPVPTWQPQPPSQAPSPTDGSSGDGQRSPWAPPSDADR